MAGTRRRRVVTTVVVALTLLGIGVGWTAAAAAIAHERDVPGFRGYLAEYVGQPIPEGPADLALVRRHPAEVLAAGDAACDWMRHQPKAPVSVDPTGYWTEDGVIGRYLAATQGGSLAAMSDYGRVAVGSAGWRYLCPGTADGRIAARHADEEGD